VNERHASTRTPASAANKATKRKTIGFGFDPESSPHHFAVVAHTQSVSIFERFELLDDDDSRADQQSTDEALKATLTRYLWDRIKEPAAAEFNRRLQADGLSKGTFTSKQTLLAPHFGKELTLLAWAVEDSDNDPTLVPTMTANWNGLAPEERWWFFTTISAAAHGSEAPPRNVGWRRAIKIALAENPVNLPPAALLLGPMPDQRRARRAAREPGPEDPNAGQLELWREEERR
jgi:hypothetical protein